MKKTVFAAIVAGTSLFAGIAAAENPKVGNAAMLSTKDIVSNALNSPVHSTLVAAVKAADLVGTLQSAGPFTVFAPVNDAFENLPAGTVETLLKPENKAKLAGILTYHVVPGKLDAAAVKAAIAKGGGKAVVKTAAGGSLTLTANGSSNVVVTDEKGGVANIVTYDVMQSNGVIHVVDAVLLPK